MRVWHKLARGDQHGPLPALLLVLTAATGVVDAVSVLSLGHVFVANMTGKRRVLGVRAGRRGVLGLVLVAFLLSLLADGDAPAVAQAALLAVAMGMQNSTARRLAVPDLTTTVLTSTLSGFAADSRRQGMVAAARRALAVFAMFVGAVIGATLLLHTRAAWALAAATVLIGLVAAVSAVSSRGDAPWGVTGSS